MTRIADTYEEILQDVFVPAIARVNVPGQVGAAVGQRAPRWTSRGVTGAHAPLGRCKEGSTTDGDEEAARPPDGPASRLPDGGPPPAPLGCVAQTAVGRLGPAGLGRSFRATAPGCSTGILGAANYQPGGDPVQWRPGCHSPPAAFPSPVST